MNQEADYVAKPVYLLIDEDGQASIVQESRLKDWYAAVEANTDQILRFTPFSPEAQSVSGKGGRIEYMTAEFTVEDEPEEGDDGSETEPEGEWAIEWELLS